MTADTFTSTYGHLRAELLRGKTIRIIDIAREQRPEAIAALAVLRDELPIRMSWATYSESYLSDSRLRVRTYRVPAEHLHEIVEALPCN